jgi:antitoxin component YwqK of YwqJK toxin-antitoxin module
MQEYIILQNNVKINKEYLDDPSYVYTLSEDKNLVILQKTEETITDEEREGIFDKMRATYSANVLKVIDIIDMDTNEHIGFSIDRKKIWWTKQKEYTVGQLIISDPDEMKNKKGLTFYKNIFMVLDTKKPSKDFVGKRIGWNYDGKENVEENYTCQDGHQYVNIKYKCMNDSKIFSEYNKCDDELHGQQIQYRNEGIKYSESNYIHGKRCGLSIDYWDNGNICDVTDYIDGKACFSENCREDAYGKSLRFYENGHPRIVENYKGGKKHGEYIIYCEDGNLHEMGQYDNDKKIGEWKSWWYRERLNKYKLNSNAEVKDGLHEISHYNDGLLDGEFITYHLDGLRNKECFYHKGELYGKYIEWANKYDGTIYKRIECDYNKGKLHGKYIERYYDGNIKEECDYVNGIKHGKWIKYESNGNYNECICTNGVNGQWIEYKSISNNIYSVIKFIFGL